jgi:hypothetical protein
MTRVSQLTVPVMVLWCASLAVADFVRPEPAPVDRVIANTKAFLAENPENAAGWYTLGRAHYLAWTLKSDRVPVNQWESLNAPNGLPNLPADWMVSSAGGNSPAQDAAVFDEHALEAIKYHRKAISLDSDHALYWIGLASVLEQFAPRAGVLGETDLTAAQIVRRMQTGALMAYRRAYELAIKEDLKHKEHPIAGLRSLVSYNAMEGYVRLAAVLGSPPADDAALAEMRRRKKHFDGLRAGAITPIVFSMDSGQSLDQLVDRGQSVVFDLDGDGAPEHRTWVSPGTALLVWDPHRTGCVTSGRQLFGSVTWWLFWSDGYAALAALDDNRDGWLTGEELQGIAVWHDHNANAVSEPGEVTPIEQTDIQGIRVTSDTMHGGSPASSRGLGLRDGRHVPTWDWVAP